MYIYIIIWIITLTILYWTVLFLLETKISAFEKDIIDVFKQRNNLIPSIFEVSKDKVVKHEEIFEETLKLRKINFIENNLWVTLWETIRTQSLIHNELNFIFRICNKHNKLLKEGRFIYIRDLIIDKSFDIGTKIELYKKIVKQYNTLINIKQKSIIWILIPLRKKQNI
jgi:hypothetical protein